MKIGTWNICAQCGVKHTRFRDREQTKPASYCHSCHASFMRKTRPKHSELDVVQRFKANVRAYANVYQRRGKLERMPCLECGSPDAEKHHPDYSQPLLVEWLCRACHLAEHRA